MQTHPILRRLRRSIEVQPTIGRQRKSRRPILEVLEDRTLFATHLSLQPPISLGGDDLYTLYTHGDSYTGAPGQDRASFLARYRLPGADSTPQLVPLAPAVLADRPPGGGGPGPQGSVGDPGAPGALAVTTQEYNFGNTPFTPAGFPGPVELIGEVRAPTTLTQPLPLVILLHGRHSTTYQGTSAFLEWPPGPGHASIPSYHGYEYVQDVLASNGYVVVSISANGINARDNGVADAGALARAQLIQRHLDIWSDLSTGSGTVSAAHTGGVAQTPFGTRFVGHVDPRNVGLMGHSRGGEGVVREFQYNQSLGSPYGIRAVFPLAPIDFNNKVINNVPQAVLLPYNDGDVSNLQGAHYFDDARYNVAGDTGTKYTIEVMGANHNYYNTIWTPGLFPAGTLNDFNGGPPSQLSAAQERGTGLAYMGAFFRTYLGPARQFLPVLNGDLPPPPSASVTADRIHTATIQPDSSAQRRDINRLIAASNLTTNTLGGTVTSGGLSTYTIAAGPGSSAYPNRGNRLSLQYSGTVSAFVDNAIPAGARDERGYSVVQFRLGVDHASALNAGAQDFSVQLTDGGGRVRSAVASAYSSNNLFKPPSGPPSNNPHTVLNTVRIPLDAFATAGFDLSDVRSVRLNFNQRSSAGLLIGDLGFAANVLDVQMSPTHNNILIRNNSGIPANVQVVNATTSAVLAEYVISQLKSIAVACDASADTLTASYQFGDPLPSGGLTYRFGPGVDILNVNDSTTAGNQTYTLTSTSVQRSGSALISFAPGGINFVNVNGGNGGNNTFNVLGTEPGWATTINANGADVVNVGSAGSLAGIQGTLTLNNTPNWSQVNVNDGADNANHPNVMLTAAALTGLAPSPINLQANSLRGLTVTVGNGDNTYTVVNTASSGAVGGNPTVLNTGNGNDTVNVQATNVTAPLTVNGGGTGSSVVNVGNGGTLAGITGAVTIFNGPSYFHVNVNDSADNANHPNVLISSTGVTGLAPAPINFTSFSVNTLAVNIGTGNNTVTIPSTPAVTSVTVSTAAGGVANVNVQGNSVPVTVNDGGTDTVILSNASTRVDGISNVTVNGNVNTTVAVDDSAFNGDDTYTVTNSSVNVARLGVSLLTYANIGSLGVAAGNSVTNDLLIIDSVSAANDTTVFGGTGPNCFSVSPFTNYLASIAGPLTVVGNGGDILSLWDQTNPASETYTFDNPPSMVSLATVAVTINFSGMAAVYLNTNGVSTVNDPSGTVIVDDPSPPCMPSRGDPITITPSARHPAPAPVIDAPKSESRPALVALASDISHARVTEKALDRLAVDDLFSL